MTDRESLRRAIEGLDDDVAEGLLKALERDPKAVRDYLQNNGFIEATSSHSEPDLTNAEEALMEVMDNIGNPKTSSEIQDIINIEYPDKLDEYNSLKHRSWISDKLNSLTKKGYLGKYREGREVKFTPEVTEAVRRWALHNDKFATDLSVVDAEQIASDTGMKIGTVKSAIKTLQEAE